MLERLAAAPKQFFQLMRTSKVGALVIVKTGGVAQQWRVSSIKIATGTLVTIKFENSKMTVDESWVALDANSNCLFLQSLGFFGDMTLKRTTNSFQIWRDIHNPGKMINGEALIVSLEWTIYGSSGENKQGLPASQSKPEAWLADRFFWKAWVKDNEPHQRLLAESIKWVCMKEEPVWGNKVLNERLTAALDNCFSNGRTVAALEFLVLSLTVVKPH